MLVEGGSNQEYRSGRVPEDLIPKTVDEDALIAAAVVVLNPLAMLSRFRRRLKE